MNTLQISELIDKWFETLLHNYENYGTTDYEFKINLKTFISNKKKNIAANIINSLQKQGVEVRVGNGLPIITCRANIHNLVKSNEQHSLLLNAIRKRNQECG